MNIHKIGHACLVITKGNTKLMFDPGRFTKDQLKITGLQAIIITHKHTDHLDPETLPEIIKNNPEAQVFCNSDSGVRLDKLNIKWSRLEDGETATVGDFKIEAFGKDHQPIYSEIETPVNTGYLINETLFHPGDSYFVPPKPVEVLAAPFSAPWGTIGQSIDYVKKVKPPKAFTIHDGMLNIHGPYDALPIEILEPLNIEFIPLKAGGKIEI